MIASQSLQFIDNISRIQDVRTILLFKTSRVGSLNDLINFPPTIRTDKPSSSTLSPVVFGSALSNLESDRFLFFEISVNDVDVVISLDEMSLRVLILDFETSIIFFLEGVGSLKVLINFPPTMRTDKPSSSTISTLVIVLVLSFFTSGCFLVLDLSVWSDFWFIVLDDFVVFVSVWSVSPNELENDDCSLIINDVDVVSSDVIFLDLESSIGVFFVGIGSLKVLINFPPTMRTDKPSSSTISTLVIVLALSFFTSGCFLCFDSSGLSVFLFTDLEVVDIFVSDWSFSPNELENDDCSFVIKDVDVVISTKIIGFIINKFEVEYWGEFNTSGDSVLPSNEYLSAYSTYALVESVVFDSSVVVSVVDCGISSTVSTVVWILPS
ncbi:hypothetical protein AGLY_013149 [Aphis glycines]|uniref:Uncharacterized protein n=1 Tax=Aphis glycines TaxID=307491 RepID=A0A6G0T5H2_APHGL|nr:hypothetical protein AGLY_013149 [Aphis glycines]